VSAEAEAKRKARAGMTEESQKRWGYEAGKDWSEEELADIRARDTGYQGRELSKEEKLQDKIEDHKTVEDAVFTEMWPEWLTVGKPGRISEESIDEIYDALDVWDIHDSRMTKEKFRRNFSEPWFGQLHNRMRDSYVKKLASAVKSKEATAEQDLEQEQFRARQEAWEKDYRQYTTREERARHALGKRRDKEGS